MSAWIRAGLVRVEGAVGRPSTRVTPGQTVTVTPPEPPPVEIIPQPMELEVVYEDDAVVVVFTNRALSNLFAT